MGISSWEQAEGVHAIPVTSTAYYGLQLPEAGVGPETQVLMVLHGWGQNTRSFLRKFAPLKKHNVLVVAPQAPHQFYLDMETRKIGFGWLTAYDRVRGIADVVSGLDAILATVEQEQSMAPTRPFVLGFSQGVSVAYRYAIHGQRDVAGVIACGGDLPPDVEERLPLRVPFPVLLIHGKGDTVVPWSRSEAADRALRALSYPLETEYFEGGHDLPASLIARFPAWMLTV